MKTTILEIRRDRRGVASDGRVTVHYVSPPALAEIRARFRDIGYTVKPAPPDRRAPLLAVLAEMPEEAWIWVVEAFLKGGTVIFPEGTGGFSDASQASIAAAIAAADAYSKGP